MIKGKAYDIVGKKFGKLTVIKRAKEFENSRVSKWLCVCECGKEKVVRGRPLVIGEIKSCGCSRHIIASNPDRIAHNFKGYKEIGGSLWTRIKSGADSRNFEFDITIEQAWNLFEKQNRICALSGVEIVLDRRDKNTTASLDRIDSSKGYVLDNIQWIHKEVNMMKNNYDEKYFIEICKAIYKRSLLNG